MSTSTKIKNLRLSIGMTQKELALRTNSSIVTVQCWENGSKNPSMAAIIALAKVFNVSSDYLLDLQEEDSTNARLTMTRSERILLNDYRKLDQHGRTLVQTVCALEKSRLKKLAKEPRREAHLRYIPKYLTPSAAGISVPLDGDDFEMIPVTDSVPRQADYAVKIQGDSMLPYVKDGDMVYVKRTVDLHNGDIGVFSVNGAMYCKHFYIDSDHNVTLVSSNPALKHTNIYIGADSNSKLTCYGKVLLDQKTVLPEYFKRVTR